jgi:hypothetical protein
MSSERQVYVLYSIESSSRILLPEVFGQCTVIHGRKEKGSMGVVRDGDSYFLQGSIGDSAMVLLCLKETVS